MGPTNAATWSSLLMQKKKNTESFYKRVSHNQSLENDPPFSLNRDHGTIGVKPQINVVIKI
jgi:hypothetical protein